MLLFPVDSRHSYAAFTCSATHFAGDARQIDYNSVPVNAEGVSPFVAPHADTLSHTLLTIEKRSQKRKYRHILTAYYFLLLEWP